MHDRDIVILSYDRQSKQIDKHWSSCLEDQPEYVASAFQALRSQYRAIGLLLAQVSSEASKTKVPIPDVSPVSVPGPQYALISFLATISCYCA
jgi:hypothetical protein